MFEENNIIIDTLLHDIEDAFLGMDSDNEQFINMIEGIN